MQDAWSEFVAARHHDLDKNWYDEYGEYDGDWVGDWGNQKKAWDRYAHCESKVSMNELKEQQQSDISEKNIEKDGEQHAEQTEQKKAKG